MKEITIRISDKANQDLLKLALKFDMVNTQDLCEHIVYLFLGNNIEAKYER